MDLKAVGRVAAYWLLVAFGLIGPAANGDGPGQPPITPSEAIMLFNGRDLEGLYGWLEDSGALDPRGVFSVEDGILRVSGDGNGGITTKSEYRDYRLVVEYKWGDKTEGYEILFRKFELHPLQKAKTR